MKKNYFSRSIEEHRALTQSLSPTAEPAQSVRTVYLGVLTAYIPSHLTPPYPTILYLPGNAFVASETGFTDFICSHLARLSGCQVLVTQHRLAPEYRYPDGLHDVIILLEKLTADAKSKPSILRIDLNRFAISGYSSGGNYAAILARYANRFNISFQVLISPMLDLTRSDKGYRQYERNDTVTSEAFIAWFLNLYLHSKVDRCVPLVSPFWEQSEIMRLLPPTHLICGEYDIFRGDAEGYFSRLNKARVMASLWVVKKENHGLLWHNLKVITAVAKIVSSHLVDDFRIEPPISNRSVLQKENGNKETRKINPELLANSIVRFMSGNTASSQPTPLEAITLVAEPMAENIKQELSAEPASPKTSEIPTPPQTANADTPKCSEKLITRLTVIHERMQSSKSALEFPVRCPNRSSKHTLTYYNMPNTYTGMPLGNKTPTSSFLKTMVTPRCRINVDP